MLIIIVSVQQAGMFKIRQANIDLMRLTMGIEHLVIAGSLKISLFQENNDPMNITGVFKVRGMQGRQPSRPDTMSR